MKFTHGKRFLVHDRESMGFQMADPDTIEVRCLEISPAGRVKLEYQSGITSWEQPSRFEIVEALK